MLKHVARTVLIEVFIIGTLCTCIDCLTCAEMAASQGAGLSDLIAARCIHNDRMVHSRFAKRSEALPDTEQDGHIVLQDEHVHQHSIVEECTDNGGRWCYNPADDGVTPKCFDMADDMDAYCICTDGADGTYDDTADEKCKSDARDTCLGNDQAANAFFGGECFDETACKAKSTDETPWTFIAGGSDESATCSPVQALCANVADTEWGNSECKCLEDGAEFHGDHCHGDKTVSTSAKWGYGIIATAIISAFAIIGVLIVLMRHQWWYNLLLSTMVALAVGCLLSDATLHLIPLSLGLHGHDDGDAHDHGAASAGHEEEKEEMTESERRNITIAITMGVYLFLLFEKLIHIIIPHNHSHGGESAESGGTELKGIEEGKQQGDVEKLTKTDGGLCAVNSVAWMVIIGDAMHNFADGLVMGAAFTNSLATGLGTSIAVFCHEVPHELGDFAVLLNAGMKIKWAILFNFLSACTCFLGLFVGLAIGENESAQKWIFAFTAGMFIYISCADLMPLLNNMTAQSKHPILLFVLQQAGFMTGFLIMWVLAVYEEMIEGVADLNEN